MPLVMFAFKLLFRRSHLFPCQLSVRLRGGEGGGPMHLSVARAAAGTGQTHLCGSVIEASRNTVFFSSFVFILNASPPRSSDINECVSGGGVCPHRRKCVNTFGSFICKCHHGFRLTYINGRYKCIGEHVRTHTHRCTDTQTSDW